VLITIQKQVGKIRMTKTSLTLKTTLLSFIAVLVAFSFFSDARATEKKVAILPLALYADPGKDYLRRGIMSMLASRLPGEDLQVIGGPALTPFLREGEATAGITSPERAGELAESLDADYAVFGSITGTGAGYSLDLSILDRTGEDVQVTNVSEAVTEDQLIPKISDVVYDFRAIIAGVDIRESLAQARSAEEEQRGGLFFTSTDTPYRFQPTGRIPVRTQVMSLDAADLDGDGEIEIAAMGRGRLMVYKRRGETLEQQDTFEASRGERFLKVSLADMNQDGRAEIYLVGFHGGRAQYRILEWSGKFKVLSDRRSGHVHAAPDQSGRHRLIFQDSSVLHIHDGDLWLMEASSGFSLNKQESLPFLRKTQIYTLILSDFSRSGVPEFVCLGEPRMDGTARIQSWNMSGQMNWETQERVGGTNNAIDLFVRGQGNPPLRVAFNPRLTTMDVDGDGKKEVLVANNELLIGHLDFMHYVDGRLVAFKYEGGRLVEGYKSRKVGYCITDIQFTGETLFISAQKPQLSRLSEGSSRIIWFE
jgi:hypothetical protein